MKRRELEKLVMRVLTAQKFVEGAMEAHDRGLTARQNLFATREEARMLLDDPGCDLNWRDEELVARVTGVLLAHEAGRL